MKLRGIGDLIVFDTFPLLFEPKQKIILTHLMHLEKQSLPAKLPMIFTTQKIADQLKKYCEVKHYKCVNKSNIVIVQPYEFIDIVLERRLTLQILFCASEEEESNNVLVLIRQNGKLNFIYGGNYTDIRPALLNDTFASWISHGVEKLYVNLKRMDENHLYNDMYHMHTVFESIENIIKCHRDSKIYIHLPLFGYEHFILKLAQHLPKRIKYSNLCKFYFNITSDDPLIVMYFLNDDDNDMDAKITLFPGESNIYQANTNFEEGNTVTINIFDNIENCNNFDICSENIYYELYYSSEPSPFCLKLLCMLVKPNRIFGIVDTFNNKSIVPKYLYELCVGAKDKIIKKQETKLNSSLSGGNSNQQPVCIIGGALPDHMVKKSGPYLSDTESDDNDGDDV